MAGRVTLKEVAVRAGVSYQTVSKVMNRQAQVSKETEARIWQAVKDLGYRPNLIARSLRSQRSYLVGYSWEPSAPGEVNPILDQFLQSMVAAAERAGYHLLAFPHHAGQRRVAAYQELVETKRVDGFILSSIDYNDPRILFLQERKFPFVAFGRSNPDWIFPWVDVDGGKGMQRVVEHLVEQGHQRIGVLAWPEASRVGQDRLAGIKAGLQAAGLALPDELLLRGDGNYQFGHASGMRLLSLPEHTRPTAIAAFNDLMAIGAMQAVQESRMQVGRDVAVTGFDDIPIVQYLNPPLTSVCQPIWEVGQKAMTMLLQFLEGEPYDGLGEFFLPTLVARQSSQAGWS